MEKCGQSAREAAEFGLNLPLDTPVRDLGVVDKQMTEIARARQASAHPNHGRAHRAACAS
jgi:ABC-type sugar transport system ATPase subunit